MNCRARGVKSARPLSVPRRDVGSCGLGLEVVAVLRSDVLEKEGGSAEADKRIVLIIVMRQPHRGIVQMPPGYIRTVTENPSGPGSGVGWIETRRGPLPRRTT